MAKLTAMQIRSATPADAPELTQLAHVSKRHWGYPEHWIEAWRDDLTFTPAFVADHEVFIVHIGGAPAACYALSAPPAEEAKALELQHFWLDPSHIGEGLGRKLFEHAVAEARSRHASALWIDSDPHAEPFYTHMGAVRMGATRADIDGVRRELPRMRFVVE
ncbi:MAG: GNAT family N-acetyltransferase [Acidobacteriota bacterium]